jgi:hypothetical protein
MGTSNLGYGQKQLENKLVIENGDTFALVQKQDIELSLLKYNELEQYKELCDSLKSEITKRDLQIELFYENSENKDSLVSKYETLVFKSEEQFNLLEEDLERLQKQSKLRLLVGVKTKVYSDFTKSNLRDVGVSLGGGLQLKDKYVIMLDGGFTFNRNLTVGLGWYSVF